MPGVYSRNESYEDNHNWLGEMKLDGFERYVLADETADMTPFENYEDAIENFWPVFIQDTKIL